MCTVFVVPAEMYQNDDNDTHTHTLTMKCYTRKTGNKSVEKYKKKNAATATTAALIPNGEKVLAFRLGICSS